MSLPAVTISKPAFSSASSPNVVTGILAVLAGAESGTNNLPGGYARSDLIATAYGSGPLTRFGAYNLAAAQTPVVLAKTATTHAGTYVDFTATLAGGSTATPATAGAPLDDYFVQVNIVTGGALGTAGITYTVSVDGGNVVSGPIALGTVTTMALSIAGGFSIDTGVSFTLGSSTQTLTAGDSWFVYTTRPQANNADILASLQALFKTRLPFEGVYADVQVDSSTVGTVDGFLASQEALGIFKFVIVNTRFKTNPQPSGESEAAYATAMGTLTSASARSNRMCIGADGAHVPDVITANNLKMPAGVLTASRAMAIPIGTDPAYVATGPLQGATVSDSNGNPFDHDEGLFPDLDSLSLTALRTFPPGGPQGTYICNANTFQVQGGSYPYLQHIRIMNAACTVAWQVLTTQLSVGVRKNPKADPVTGAVYIFEPDAAKIEALVNDALTQTLKGQVSAVQFSLSRTDNLNVVPTVLSGFLSIVANAYVKGFNVTAAFTKTIQTAA